MTTKEKVSALRSAMAQQNIRAFIIYSADPHMSEYLPVNWKERAWISGFTGSAGFVVITDQKAGLWTDGRYFTQADIELKDSGIDLFKMGIEGTPDYKDWIISQTEKGEQIGVNALATSHKDWLALEEAFTTAGRSLTPAALLDSVWADRPAAPSDKVFVQPLERSGKSALDKINEIRKQMADKGADLHVVSALDDIAWTVNLRGSDVDSNPVFLSYLVISPEDTLLFVDQDKPTAEARDYLADNNIKQLPYNSFFQYLEGLEGQNILIAPSCNQQAFEALKTKNNFVLAEPPAHLMKAIKNETELKGFHEVLVKDGVAMVNFLFWLKHRVGQEEMDEVSIGEKLNSFRAAQKNFRGLSFSNIVGYQGNGAIIHYSAKKETCAKVKAEGSILVDSGGQYLEGTSDITRTMPLGTVSDDFKRDYTLVLKGHIQLAMAKFPKGTRGSQLDILARLPLWEEGKDYNHGTGHGVGSFLNVHEGPQSIRKEINPQVLLPGMVISNEPGYYVVGKYGIRHENLVIVREWKKTEWNTFYEFETATLCPIDNGPIVKELLSAAEIQWLNDYHKKCQEKLSPFLDSEVLSWFNEMVAPL